MYPILVSFGPISIYTAHVFAIVAWCIFSFLFWKQLRSQGILEERIFDLTFYSTLVGVVFARFGFVVLFPQLFMPSVLLIGAFWIQPGLWLYGGLLGVFLAFYFLTKRYNLRFTHVFDAFSYALPWTMIPLSLAAFFAGSEVGKVTHSLWAIVYPKVDGTRHPIQIYEIIVFLLIGFLAVFLNNKSQNKKWPSGFIGSLLLTVLSLALFSLEFFKAGSLYLYGITINQWILVLLFAESVGSLIIKMKRMGIIFPKKGDTNHDAVTSE